MLSLSKQDYWQAQGRVPFQSQARVKSEKRKENFASGLSLKSYEEPHKDTFIEFVWWCLVQLVTLSHTQSKKEVPSPLGLSLSTTSVVSIYRLPNHIQVVFWLV